LQSCAGCAVPPCLVGASSPSTACPRRTWSLSTACRQKKAQGRQDAGMQVLATQRNATAEPVPSCSRGELDGEEYHGGCRSSRREPWLQRLFFFSGGDLGSSQASQGPARGPGVGCVGTSGERRGSSQEGPGGPRRRRRDERRGRGARGQGQRMEGGRQGLGAFD